MADMANEKGDEMMTMYPTIPTMLKDGTEMISYAHEGDAWLDLCATEDVTLMPQEWRMVGSGVSMAIPKGFVGLVVPRSGMGCKGLVFKNSIGIIDAGYRGEIKMPLYNNNPTHVWQKSYNENFSQRLRRTIYDLLLRPCTNRGNVSAKGEIHVHKGDRVAQLLIVPVAQASLVQVDTLDESERGQDGFGSTGVRL
jgi:dUTP pyrophosphatase